MERYSDETVMAYVDGELDDAQSARLEAAMEHDAELTARVEMFAETRSAAQESLRPLLDEPVPAALRQAVEAMAERHAAAGAAPVRRRIFFPANDWGRMAAAACVAAVLGGAVGYFSHGATEQPQLAQVDGALAAALDALPTGGEQKLGGATLRLIGSFVDQAQKFCREFELSAGAMATTSITCHDGRDWQVRLVVAAPAAGGYAPASASETLDAYLAAIGAGAPLDPAAERQAMQNLPGRTE